MDPWLEQFEARRKEREAQDRTIEVFGERLVVKPGVAPEPGLRLAEFQARVAKYQVDVEEARQAGKPIPEMGVSDDELLDLAESTIRVCLEPASIPAWERLRAADAEYPMTLMDIYAFSTYVLSRAVGLPTAAPEGSSATPATNGRSSTAGSRSRVGKR